MNPLQFYRLVAPIISASRCGHTNIRLSEEDEGLFLDTALFLPFSIYWQAPAQKASPATPKSTAALEGVGSFKALVNQNALVPQLPLGSEILKIDGVEIATVMSELMDNLASDGENLTLKIRAINDGFRYYYALDRDVPEVLKIEYVGPEGGGVKVLEVRGALKSAIEAAGDGVMGTMMAAMGSGKSRYEGYSLFENHMRLEKDYAFLRMAHFYPDSGESVESLNAFIDDFFAKVKASGVKQVVVDVRDNFGGDPNVGAHLLSYLAKAPVPYFTEDSGMYYPDLVAPIALAENRFSGQVYVLINGNCFSTTGHFLALMKYHRLGVMIGEESGGSFACTDASDARSLSYTGLQFKSSRSVFKVAVEGLTPGRGIMPDYPVAIDLEALLSNQDVVLAKALELMAKRQ